MRSLLLISVVLLMVSSQAVGVELARTPVQDAMQLQLAMDEWNVQPTPKSDKDETPDGMDQRPSGRKSVVRAALTRHWFPVPGSSIWATGARHGFSSLGKRSPGLDMQPSVSRATGKKRTTFSTATSGPTPLWTIRMSSSTTWSVSTKI